MEFTPLHRALGVEPEPLTDALLTSAVEHHVTETHDLDWKAQLPPIKGIPNSDFPKDVAAMANSGGGIIVYGVTEEQKAATSRTDVGDFSEGWERALRNAAITAISPPVFGLKIHRLGTEKRAVVVEITSSVDGPHLIYRNELFGAPVRNDADTVWMKERQIEAMYRTRFDERLHASATMDALYTGAAAGRDTGTRAWFIGVARPRVPKVANPMPLEEVKKIFNAAMPLGMEYADSAAIHPLQNVDWSSPRPGLRSWVSVNTATQDNQLWKQAWASVHHDGSVTLAAAVGGHMKSNGAHFPGHEIHGQDLEGALADLMALMRETAASTDNDEYEVRIGIEWAGEDPMKILTRSWTGEAFDGVSTPLHRYVPVEMSVDAGSSDSDFRRRLYELALDCVNQGGLSSLRLIQAP